MSKLQVVVGYDYTPPSELAVERAIELAAAWPARHTLHMVTVLERDQSYQTAERVRGDLLAAMRARLDARLPGVDIELFAHVRIGDAADEILDVAAELGADLIIVGSHDRTAIGRFLLGSVSESVVDNARCTVLVARPKTYQNVELAPVEEVPDSEHHHLRELPHRYSYSSNIAQTRPNDWPIS
jgi:nucleotide-binding universal stress UspA family protein